MPAPVRLQIEPIIKAAHEAAARARRDLPTHKGLAHVSEGVVSAAIQAEKVARAMQRPFSPHRLPAMFLALALLTLLGWVYWRFFYVTSLTLALPDRDASALRERLRDQERVDIEPLIVPGSREAAEKVARGEVDLAFVQGGIELPRALPRARTASPELVLWMTRPHLTGPSQVRKILTSIKGEGSHTVAQAFVRAWGVGGQVSFVHDWSSLTQEEAQPLAADIDAVLVVKDPADEKTLRAVARLHTQGFRLTTPEIGARASTLDYLSPTEIPSGYLQQDPDLPSAPLKTYAVATFLVAREGMTPRLLGEAARVLEEHPATIDAGEFHPSVSDAGEIFQGIEAFLGVLVNVALAFLALLGLDGMAYRKYFHELNSLVSLISTFQSDKDVLGLRDPRRKAENLAYLGYCSDLLGLVSAIGSYYTQENSSLLFSNLSEIIHQRCDGLKINIQLKILHATIPVAAPEDAQTEGSAHEAGLPSPEPSAT
jgi:hypothetical protein